jgi:hypothetical protein
MDNPLLLIALAFLVYILLHLAVLFLLAGGDRRRMGLALRIYFRTLRDPATADKVEALLSPPPPPPPGPVRPSGTPLRALALLQREGRLLDFLLEDIQAYSDDQVGAAVRDIHRQCRAALNEHLVLEPVLPQAEGDNVQVPAGFDPSAVRLTGNVTGTPPFTGVLRHHGWRAKAVKLPVPPEGQDELILMPAEVELP